MQSPSVRRLVWTSVWSLWLSIVVGAHRLDAQQPGSARLGREDVEGLMDAYIINKLQESLELTDEQFGQVVLAQKRLNQQRREYRQQRMKALEQLRLALAAPDWEDEKIAALLKQMDEAQREFQNRERDDYEAIDRVLTVRQRARYRVLEAEIQRRFQEMLREIRARQRPRQPVR